ncbi:larval cuticle protein LCP-17-like [Plodia interpunctella]|uniref:larval cuticle protein LCP-17-like n=1 Tax=Plodia interpunctella TaxID=58824 RepID=UPI002367FFB8|nr:larval cuticle protein LCP-17-like [Plodia interpunctella]
MKSFILFAVLAVAAADVSHVVNAGDQAAEVVRSSYENSPEGNFQSSFETSNGIASQVEGVVKNLNSDNPTLEIKGQSSWTAPDGTPVQFSYLANEDGYQPTGNLIPVAPPIPEAILRSLKYIEEHPPVEKVVQPVAYQPTSRNFG